MSRFYDVLRQAGHSLHHPQEPPEPPPQDLPDAALSFEGMLNAPEEETPAEAHAAGTHSRGTHNEEASGPAAIPALHRPLEEEDFFGTGAGSRNGGCGKRTDVHMDQKARLLPHVTDPAIIEHYRLLRTRILQRQSEKMFKSLLVTSPSPKEGKTVTTLNVGLTFAMLPSFRVLVVDGDLRRGSLGAWLGATDHPGLGNLLEGTAALEEVILKSDDIPVDFIVRGNSTAQPAELLHSPRMRSHFREMADRYDLVLVDSPPVSLVTDAQLLAGACDAVLLVSRAFVTSTRSLEAATREMQRFRVIGAILNGGTGMNPYNRYRSYY